MSSQQTTVTMAQIQQLEEKIAALNNRIAEIMEQKEEQDQSPNIMLQASDMVKSDETLDWKLSAVDI